MTTRRDFLQSTLLGAATGAFAMNSVFADAAKPAPVRRVTSGPKFHWRGYFDIQLFDPTDRFLVANEVEFEGRSPTTDDSIRVGVVDLQDKDRWIELGTTRAWNWQQAALLQWIPGTPSSVIWNDRQQDRFVSHIVDVATRERRTLDNPIYALSPDGRWGFFPDFRRLNSTRPGYGYGGIADPNASVSAPENAGIWRNDLSTGKAELIIPFSAVAAIPIEGGYPEGTVHWFNHLGVSPSGNRLFFLHRWRVGKSHLTRLLTANIDGSDLFVVNPPPMTSHLVWRDPEHILAYAYHEPRGRGLYLFKDKTDQVQRIENPLFDADGHCTYPPNKNNAWVLYDSYPSRQDRKITVFLYHLATGKDYPLGRFLSPKEYTGEWRCDLHPTASRSGRYVSIDSVHEGLGRQIYLIDAGEIVGS